MNKGQGRWCQSFNAQCPRMVRRALKILQQCCVFDCFEVLCMKRLSIALVISTKWSDILDMPSFALTVGGEVLAGENLKDEFHKIQFSRHSFIQVFVYFSYSPSSWILSYGLVSTTKKDDDLIENVLRRASKMLPRLSNLTYEERLAKIEILSMKYQRMRGDMIMVYKYWMDTNHRWNIYLQLIIIR